MSLTRAQHPPIQANQRSQPAPQQVTQAARRPLGPGDIQHFISHGYVVVKPELDTAFHDMMSNKLAQVECSNNVLPACPELQAVYDDTRIAGALDSLLGSDRIVHPHRHMHVSPPNPELGRWHKDSQWGYRSRQRDNHLRWVMLLYFPQAIPAEMGATGIAPGLHYTHQHLGVEQIEDLGQGTIGEAGTCVIMHYDMWHARFPNLTDLSRIMVKMQFVGLSDPARRAGGATLPDWDYSQPEPPIQQRALWQDMWRWRGGTVSQPELRPAGTALADLQNEDWLIRARGADDLACLAALQELTADHLQQLATCLKDDIEVVATNAAIALGRSGLAGHNLLAQDIETGPRHPQSICQGILSSGQAGLDNAKRLLQQGDDNLRGIGYYILGELGQESASIDQLRTGLADASNHVVSNATYGLAVHPQGHEALPSLIACLQEESDETRMNALFAILRHCQQAAAHEETIINCLNDGNRYVRAYACECLERLGTANALQALVQFLKTRRWCDVTTAKSTF